MLSDRRTPRYGRHRIQDRARDISVLPGRRLSSLLQRRPGSASEIPVRRDRREEDDLGKHRGQLRDLRHVLLPHYVQVE